MVQISPQKYLFDHNDFDEAAVRARIAAARRPTFSQDEMEASRQTGFAQGRAEGQREAMASLEAQLRELMQQVSHTAALFLDNETARLAAFIDQSSLITAQILVRTMPVLLQTLSLVQIENFVRDTLRTHVKKGKLIILVAPNYAEPIKERIKDLADTTPHLGDWTIDADPTLSAYQCRVEWSGGGAEWNPENVANIALQTIFDHLPDELKVHAMDGQSKAAKQEQVHPEQLHVDDSVQTTHTDIGETP